MKDYLLPYTVAFGGTFLAGAAFGAGEQIALRSCCFEQIIKRAIGIGLQTGGMGLGVMNLFVGLTIICK
jgi:hypothetical protein